MKENPNLFPPPDGGPPSPSKIIALLMCLIPETAVFVLYLSVYTETIGLFSDQFLSELPGVGPIFGMIDEEMTAAHLLAGILAFFTVFVPIHIWNVVLREKIHEQPQTWLSKPMNQVHAAFLTAIFGLVVFLEVTNLYALIAQQAAPNAFGIEQSDEWLEMLAAHEDLGLLVACLMALINTIVALMTARTVYSIKHSR